jgi:hypothetical protein
MRMPVSWIWGAMAIAGDIIGRSDDEMKSLLASLTPSLQVMPAQAYGRTTTLFVIIFAHAESNVAGSP